MSLFGQRYVIDTNALSQIGMRRRQSPAFLEQAVIPEEVLHEAEGFPDVAALQELLQPVSSRTLYWLERVMSTVPESDVRLVNLYANRGNADPFVVASALEMQEQDSQFLDAPEWLIVTGDQAVRDKAEEFGLRVLTSTEFAFLMDDQFQ
jgi:hypothetical protein